MSVYQLFVIDEIITGTINMELSPETYLLLPPRSHIDYKTELKSYFDSPEMYVDNLKSLYWLLDESKREFKNFDLSGNVPAKTLGTGKLQEVLERPCLLNISSLCLSKLGLTVVPDVHHLKHLDLLDISGNNIIHVDNTFRHEHLAKIYLEGNPINILNLNLQSLPKLVYIRAGSTETEKIGKAMLLKMLDGLELDISPKFKDLLKTPEYNILYDTKKLKKFLNIAVCDLSKDKVGKLTLNQIEIYLRRFTSDITTVNLDGQTCVSDNDTMKLNEMLSNLGLFNLNSLYLSSCSLEHFPQIRCLKKLTHLDADYNPLNLHKINSSNFTHSALQILHLKHCKLKTVFDIACFPNLSELYLSNNKIKFLDQFNQDTPNSFPLKRLCIDENPIKEIKINFKVFIKLTSLRLGSQKTKYISFAILKRAGKGELKIEVLPQYKKNLVFYPSAGGQDAMNRYVDDEEVDVASMPIHLSVKDKYEALLWLFNQEEKRVHILRFSGQKEFFKENVIDLDNFFNNPRLHHTVTVYLDNCNLQRIPFKKGAFPSLKTLHFSNNKLTEISIKHFNSPSKLEKMIIDGNPIKTVHINKLKRKFPNLSLIQAGSIETHYLSPPILEAMAKKMNALAVRILPEYAKYMICPPAEILQGKSEEIRSYLNLKSQKAHDVKFDMLKNTTKNTLVLLGKPEAGKTSLVTTLREGFTSFTTEYQRTIILERSNLPLAKNVTISTYDFGAQDIYELEYPMFLRGRNIIALIVFDVSRYKVETHDENVGRWLNNCVLCANCEVIFVPSKCEQISSKILESKQLDLRSQLSVYIGKEIEFLKTEEDILERVAKSSKRGKTDRDRIERSINFFNKLKAEITVEPTSVYIQEGLDALKTRILKKIDTHPATDIPELYSDVMSYMIEVSTEKKYYITLEDVECYVHRRTEETESLFTRHLKKPSGSKMNIKDMTTSILNYYHGKGCLLWYETCHKYVYINIDDILRVHRQLYRHDLDNFLQYDFDKYHDIISNEVLFLENKSNFLMSGLVSTDILKCIWKGFNFTEEEFDSMIQLLIANDHCFVDVDTMHDKNRVYRFPWFLQDKLFDRKQWPELIPYQYIEFSFKYTFFRKLPATMYERISVRLHSIFKEKCKYSRRDWKDGVHIVTDKIKLLLQRHTDLENPELTIDFRAQCHEIDHLWEWCFLIYTDVLKKIIEDDTIVTYSKVFVCPHCLLAGNSYEDLQHYQLGVVMDSQCGGQVDMVCEASGKLYPCVLSNPLLPG